MIKKRAFIWGLTLFILGFILTMIQAWTFIYSVLDLYQLIIESVIMALALSFVYAGGNIVNKTLQ